MNKRLNNFENIQLIENPISDKDGYVNMRIHEGSGMINQHAREGDKSQIIIRKESISLDSFS